MRHVLGLSGGKDSAALALYMRDREPKMEYFFCDTGAELPETYEFLDKIEEYLGKRVARLKSERDFEGWLDHYKGFLPNPRARWCTRKLKIEPLERWLGEDPAITYIGIRADEPNRKGYIDVKGVIEPKFPFIEDGITLEGVKKILEDSGVGMPEYYRWRSRSGCHFCFFQRKSEWVGLAREHPELFENAVRIEESTPSRPGGGKKYTFNRDEPLTRLITRKDEILARAAAKEAKIAARRQQMTLEQALLAEELEDPESAPCHACTL